MRRTKHLADKVGLVCCTALVGALTGCTSYDDHPRSHRGYEDRQGSYRGYENQPRTRDVYAPPPRAEAPVYQPSRAMEVEASYVGIRTEADFYEPLSPYGRWQVVGSYGRCWIPGRVARDWRPYCNGHWVRCDAGWYWASDEPWGWATYHYGRWDFSPQYGWFWVPQTQWAPAWVSWHRGGGYVGWAPLYPSSRVGGSGYVEVDERSISPKAYVFVEERRFMEPVRPKTVVVNNTTIINKTVNITKVKVVNKTVINEGPQTEVIEQVSGRKVQPAQVRDLRRKAEAEVVAKHKALKAPKERKDQTTDSSEAELIATKAVVPQQPRQIEQPAVTTQQPVTPAPMPEVRETDAQKRATKAAQDQDKRARKNQEPQAEIEKAKPVPVATGVVPEAGRPAAIEQPSKQQVQKLTAKEKKRIKELEKQAKRDAERRAREEQAASKQGGTNTVDKVHKNNAAEQPTPTEEPPVPPQASQ